MSVANSPIHPELNGGSPDHLLTNEQMRRFISRGYLLLQTDFPKEFHATLNAKLSEVMEKEGNPGNNILPRLSEVNEIFQHPVIRGALSSVLGPNYMVHPHRHCHFTYPGRKVQEIGRASCRERV